MKPRFRLFSSLRRATLPALAIIFTGFFGYSAILGPNGMLAYRDYNRQADARLVQLAALEREQAELRNRVRLLDPKGADPDLVDELTRKKLGVVEPEEVIIPLD